MGIRNALRLADQLTAAATRSTGPATGPRYPYGDQLPPLASPWGDGVLDQLLVADLYDTLTWPTCRREAMAIPALARGRNILCPTIARVPLRALRLDAPTDPQPSWLTRTDGLVSPFHRMLWTLDDQLFHGAALWGVERGSDLLPLRCWHIPHDAWTIDQVTQTIMVNDGPADAGAVIYLPGPHEGILNFAPGAIRGASILETSALETSRRPFRVELHQTTDEPMPAAEIDALIAKARQALATNDGILYTNAALTAIVHNYDSSQLLVEGRNANDVNMARLVGLPANLIDANTAGSSLTYETSAGRNQQAVDYGFAAYMASVAARLSMDDVVPHGSRVAWDLADLTGLSTTPTGPTLED